MPETRDLTPEEVAEQMKIKTNTVYELIKRGELAAYRVGRKLRIEPQAVEDYKRRQGENSSAEIAAMASELPAPAAAGSSEAILCGQDMLLDSLARWLEQRGDGISILRRPVDSFEGLSAVYAGRADMAAIHLWDADSDTYNLPYVRRLLPGIPTLLIHVVKRWQGFYVRKGNPLHIKGWEDLRRPELHLINRESGSGSRVLLDERLRLMGMTGQQVSGYRQVEYSPLTVAGAVAGGLGDLGLGHQKAALQTPGIEFIPLQLERYELVIREEEERRAMIQLLLNTLAAPAFQAELAGWGGYDLSECGRVVARL